MHRRTLVHGVLTGLLIALVACSPTTPGEPRASSDIDGTTTTTSSPKRTTSKPSPTDSPVSDVDPCDLLDDKGKSQLGLSGAGKPDDLGSGRGCRWTLRGPKDTFIFGVVIYDRAGLKDLPNDLNNKPLPDIGSHKAIETHSSDNPGTCTVTIGVTETSRISAETVTGTDQQKACENAVQLAQLIEPNIP